MIMGDCAAGAAVSLSGRANMSFGFPKYTSDFEWKFYKSLVENYFAQKAVTDNSQQKELFFAYLPVELLNLVFALIGLENLSTSTMSDIFDHLSTYFETEKPLLFHRRSFYRRDRGEQESIVDYAKSLRDLADCCHFGNDTNAHLCNCFMMGLKQERLQKMLADCEGEAFDALVKRAVALESTIAQDIRGQGDGPNHVKVERAEPIACEFKNFGCDFEGSKRVMEEHVMNSISKHLLMAIRFLQGKVETVAAVQKTDGDAQKQQDDLSRQKVDGLNQELDALTQLIEPLKLQNDTQSQKIDTQIQQLGIQTQLVNTQQLSINTHEKQLSSLQEEVKMLKKTEFVWCIQDVAVSLKACLDDPTHRIKSQVFYSKPNGCFFSSEVNVSRINKEKYFGIHWRLHPGTYDAIQQWPLVKRLGIILHTQSNGLAKDVVKSFMTDWKKWEQFKMAPKVISSVGYADFIPLELLKKFYVKDDKLFITVFVEDP